MGPAVGRLKGAHALDVVIGGCQRMQWRLIPLETVPAAWAMALEEVLLERVATGGRPTVRFWRWEASAATIGRFQDVDAEVDLEYCHLRGIEVVRRMSGGGAVFHDSGGEFVYSITATEASFPAGVVEAYRSVLDRVLSALEALGVEAWVKDDNNVMVGDRKVSGNSQRRSRGVLQVHGTVLWRTDEETMFSVLRARAGEPVETRGTPSRHHPVAGLQAICGVTLEETYDAVLRGLVEGRGWQATSWMEDELTRARELVTARYGNDRWNLSL